ncbi:hypothetical protein DLJ53_18610 [Acuticoccus sediminis]|uniref:SnoaL-like domain-containing protein n=1 Tax=Acuticoccus sediminis TaxID=2184697 RepID=A0A8B2NJX2_9HYPH|nr:nuclear transport factor 2 family protein [Acuticoccus sediminis]RAH99775.1 hypothetical protein DLJ53_18610 [Acuticoccus sediminis]
MTPTETVHAFFDAYSKADLDASFALFHPEVHHTADSYNTVSRFCGTWDGLDALRSRVHDIIEHWSFETFAPVKVVAQGDDVAVKVHAVGVERHTGQRIEMNTALFFTVQDGRIVAVDEIFDSALIERAMEHPAA